MSDLPTGSAQIRLVDPEHPDARRCLAAYVTELDQGSHSGYDPAAGVSAQPHELRPPRGRFLVVYLDDVAVGCAALKHTGQGVTEVKRMWVDPARRGRGLSRLLLEELERHAVADGARALRLETNAELRAAIALYRSAGFAEVEPFNDEPFADHWFRKELGPARGGHTGPE